MIISREVYHKTKREAIWHHHHHFHVTKYCQQYRVRAALKAITIIIRILEMKEKSRGETTTVCGIIPWIPTQYTQTNNIFAVCLLWHFFPCLFLWREIRLLCVCVAIWDDNNFIIFIQEKQKVKNSKKHGSLTTWILQKKEMFCSMYLFLRCLQHDFVSAFVKFE